MKGMIVGLSMVAIATGGALAFEKPFDENDDLDVAAGFLAVNLICEEDIFTPGYIDQLIAIGAGQRGITRDEAVEIVIPRMFHSRKRMVEEGLGPTQCAEFRDLARRIPSNKR